MSRRCRRRFSRPGVRGMSPDPGGERREDRVEVFNDRLFAADHHAIAAFQAPDAAARSHVHIVDLSSPGSSLARRMSST